MHFNRSHFFALCMVFHVYSFAQTLKGRVLDASSKQPVPFANVLLSDTYGVITNDEGYFSILQKDFKESDLVRISMLGYEELRISVKELKAQPLVLLKTSVMMLNEVIVGVDLNPETIIKKYRQNAAINHTVTGQRIVYFSRLREQFKPNKFSIDVGKVSFENRKALQKNIDNFTKPMIGNTFHTYTEKLSEVFVTNGGTKMGYIKGLKLKDPSVLDINQMEKSFFENTFKKLESPYTYKMSSGIIPLDNDVSMDEIGDGEEEETLRSSSYCPYLGKGNVVGRSFIKETKDYEYTLKGIKNIGDQSCYHITFAPYKNKGDYVGEMYINTDDYAMMFYKYTLTPGKTEFNLNLKLLLGIKARTDGTSTEVMMGKLKNGKYYPRWIKKTQADYIYFDRSLKMIENNPKRSERKKLKLSFLVEMNSVQTEEVVAVEVETFSEPNLSGIRLPESVPYDIKTKYDPNYWKAYNIIEATEEMKNYRPQSASE
jgi:hypothetical protein